MQSERDPALSTGSQPGGFLNRGWWGHVTKLIYVGREKKILPVKGQKNKPKKIARPYELRKWNIACTKLRTQYYPLRTNIGETSGGYPRMKEEKRGAPWGLEKTEKCYR
jgi:hypothetical protein